MGIQNDENVEDTEAALTAAPSDASQEDEAAQPAESAPVPIFPNIAGKGEEAFGELLDFFEQLRAGGHSFSDPKTWKQAGLRNYNHVMRIASGYALQAAQDYYQSAVANKDMSVTADTWRTHPAYDYEAAMAWLFKANGKLLSDRTYAKLGGSVEAFYGAMRKAYADFIHQGVRLAGAMLDADSEDEQALKVIEHIRNKAFKRLGIDDIDDAAAGLTGITAQEFAHIEHRAAWAVTRSRLRETVLLRWRGRNGLEYAEKMLDAWEASRYDETVLNDPALFEGTNFTKKTFEAEVERVMDILIEEPLARLEKKDVGAEELHGVIERFQHWRWLFGRVPEPQDINPEYSGEDYWRAGLLKKFDNRSFTHMMEGLCQIYGVAIANNALMHRTTADPGDIYDELIEAREALEKGGIAFDREEAFDRISLDRDAFFCALDETAPVAIGRDFNESHYPGQPSKIRLQLLNDASDAFDRIYATPAQNWMSVSPEALGLAGRKATLREAEECVALSRAALGRNGAYTVMQPAVQLLESVDLSLTSPDFYEKTGMSAQAAQTLAREYACADMAVLWKAASEIDEEPVQRLVYAIEFAERLSKMNGMDAATVMADIRGGEGAYESHLELIARNAMNDAVAKMSRAPNNALANAQHLQTIRNGLNLINPDALEHPGLFKRLTNQNLNFFLQIEQENAQCMEQLCAPENAAFKITKTDAVKRLKAIQKMKHGAQGWIALRDLRHDAVITGFSLADNKILNRAGMNAYDLSELNYNHASGAAQAHLDAAIARKTGTVSLHDLDAHAYSDYSKAQMWVMRAGVNVLADSIYQDMGLAGRADFIDRLRESMFDYIGQLEAAVMNEGVTTAGPVRFFDALEKLRDLYQVAGLENHRADTDAAAQEHAPWAGNVATVRRAIEKYRPAACLSILNDKEKSPAAKYRAVRKILEFSKRMQVPVPLDAKTLDWDNKFGELIKGRIVNVIETFGKNPEDMARGWRVARAIDQIRRDYALEKTAWFDDLFERIGYGDFNAFCEDMAIKRMDQLFRRCERRHHQADSSERNDPVMNRDMIADLGRIRSVIESPVLRPERIVTLLDHSNITREWMTMREREAALFAIPLFIDLAYEPTMQPADREGMLEDLFRLREVAGSENWQLKRIDWDELAQVRGHMTLAILTQGLMVDMLRIEAEPSWSPGLLRAYAMMEELGLSMGDAGHLHSLELSPGEAEKYAKLEPLALPYSLLLQLDQIDKSRVNDVHNLVFGIFSHAKQHGFDLGDAQVQRKLGMRSDAEMRKVLLTPALTLARTFSHTLRNTKDDIQAWNIGGAMQKFMEVTGLERRLEQDVLEKHGVMDSEGLHRLMVKLTTELGGTESKAAALAPA